MFEQLPDEVVGEEMPLIEDVVDVDVADEDAVDEDAADQRGGRGWWRSRS